MVSLPSKNMSLSIGPFPNGLPVSPLTLLSLAPAFLQPKSFWDIWDLSDSLSFHVSLSFQWVSSHAGLPGNEQADLLAKTGATLPIAMFSAPWLRLLQRLDTLATLCGDELFLATPSPAKFRRFPQKNWPFLVLSAVNCLDFAATITAFFCPLTYAE